MIWIVTDSAQEVTAQDGKNIEVVNLPVIVNGAESQGPIESEEFFSMLDDANVSLSTSQASPAVFADLFEKLTANGDEVVAILVSSTLSGTYNSARLAASGCKGVHLIDSHQAVMSESALVSRAMQLRSAGLCAAEIAQTLEVEKKDVCLMATLPTLRYLKKSGRISAARASIGDLASIRPILTIDESGEVVPFAKARGTRKAIRACAQKIMEANPDFDRPLFIGYSGLDRQPALDLKEELEALCGFALDVPIVPLSQMLCIHTGPGACGAGFFKKNG